MNKILCGRNLTRNPLSKNTRRFSEGCQERKPEYECVRQKKPSRFELSEADLKARQHPFLKKSTCHEKPTLWRNVFFFACVPAIAGAMINAFYIRPKPTRPPYAEYSYLRIMTKRFPWRDGQKSLFYNPRMNALPGGYETELEDEDEA